MKREYNELNLFIDDVHNELSIKDTILDFGLISKSDFHGDFTNCIFHDGDNTPSLQITDDFWKCYGCGLKGDLFSFLQTYYNIDFISSVNFLADKLNINIKNARVKFDKRYNDLKEEWNGYLNNMSNAPKEIQELKRDYFPQEIGYDKNINYIVLALTSKTGTILGFTKRRIGPEIIEGSTIKRPKWKHSSLNDSLINQCHNVFNLHNASAQIRRKKEVIVTEGPKDTIAYERSNLNYVVCMLGTNNLSNIWSMVFPVKYITLSLDADAAGRKATKEELINLTKFFDLKNINAVLFEEGFDPYDVMNKYGTDKLVECYNSKIPAIEYFLMYADVNEVYDLYQNTPAYNKIYILKNICKYKGFTINEAESWIDSAIEKNEVKTNSISEKEQLLAIVNCEDKDVAFINIDKAKRILKMKYNIRV